MDFLNWYKHKIESGNLEPPELVWENIQDELDIEKSWQVINQHLTRRAIERRNTIVFIAAGLLLLIAVGTWWYFLPDQAGESSQILAEGINETEQQTVYPKPDTPGPQTGENITVTQIPLSETEKIQELLPEQSINGQGVAGEKNEENEERRVPQRMNYETIENRVLAINSGVKDDLTLSESYPLFPDESANQRASFRKLYIGSTGQLANTWLLNEKTFSGLEPSSLTSSDLSLGSYFGVFLGTNLTRKIDLQMDLNILAQNNQVYHEYIDGHYVENKMKFNYSQLALSLRYSFFSKRILRGEHGLNLGGYTGYLHNANQQIGSETIDLSSDYNQLDYGLFMGYEYVFPVYQQLGVGTGFRVYYGLQNIYSGNKQIPAYLNKTNIASANLTLSLKYLIK